MSDDRKRKRSWREIDRERDKSRHRRMERPGTDPYSHRTNRGYKAELDRFFEKGVASDRIKDRIANAGTPAKKEPTETPERIKLIRRIRAAETFDDFVQAVDELREQGDLPDDVEVLVRTLEHPDEGAIQAALERLKGMAKRLNLTDLKSVTLRLDSLENITSDPTTLKLIEEVRAKL